MDERPHASPWIAALARPEALPVMAEHDRNHHGGAFTCPNGHRVDRIRTSNCPEPGCRAHVVYEPAAVGMAKAARLRQVELLAETWMRAPNTEARRLGAELKRMLGGRT
jgi:hypothetical protein